MAGPGSLSWRCMRQSDLVDVERVGDAVHPDYPEDATVIAERLRLYPAGCLVLEGEKGVMGYAVAHPWLFGHPPPLNTLLKCLPDQANTFYIHDLALMSEMRGGGVGTKAVELLADQAKRDALASMSLVAVGGSLRFWRRSGFQEAGQEVSPAALATYGGAIHMTRVLR